MSDDTGFVLAIHGGAGTINKALMSPEKEDAYHAGLRQALDAGYKVLKQDGSAVDAVAAAVVQLEEDPLFNAGRGAVFNSAGQHEMDAAIMEGAQKRAGAITGICGPRNPVLAAKAVMEQSEHVFFAGEGATEFCHEAGLEFVDPEWFYTQARWDALQNELQRRAENLPDDGDESRKHGTVGAVACDVRGHVAAATSTGGMTAKKPGRVGDTPVIGAGTWADDQGCAVSATGHGEFFIRHAVGQEISSRMRWGRQTLQQASDELVLDILGPIGGSGGIIAVDPKRNIALPFNCSGMYRGFIREDGTFHTAIYHEEYREAPADS
ncbi:isoaspartyl peptidase/L-asparaginase [Microvirga sp. W0021]|uniref:Isoaspartyl peptidase/L-asparaginase n=2 Tax=Hohaiivirga grylli TaxID=3133970 RepID=A0ABV0BL94_9HYPH